MISMKAKRDMGTGGTKVGQEHETFVGPSRRCHLISFFVISVFCFICYSNILESPFVFDDYVHIKNNPHVRLKQLDFGSLYDAAFEGLSPYRPIAAVSFALNYYIGQYDPRGYHIVNILVHLTCGIFVYFLGLIIFQQSTKSLNSSLPRSFNSSAEMMSLLAALIFTVHPIQTQSVTYTIQRMNSMAAMFYILSLFLYVKGRLGQEQRALFFRYNGQPGRADEQPSVKLLYNSRRHYLWFAGSVLAWMFALGSKEIAVTLPFFVLLYEWYFFQDLKKAWLKRHLGFLVATLVILSSICLLFLGSSPLERLRSIGDYSMNEFTFWERVVTQPRVVIYYLTLFLYPHPTRLNLDYDFPLSSSFIHPPTTLLSVAAIVGMMALACCLAKRERLISFAILWFFGNLVVESSVIPLAIIFEHRTYLPSMFVPFIIVTLIHRYVKPKWVGVAALCAVVATLSAWTYERNSVWSDGVKLWEDCVSKSPNKARPHYNLGRTLAPEGQLDEAISQFRKAIKIRPDFVEAHTDLGAAFMDKGNLNKALSHFYTSLQLKKTHSNTHYNLGRALSRQGRLNDAISHLSTALKLEPLDVDIYNELGNALVRLGHYDEGADLYLEALRIEPDDVKAHGNLGVVMMGQGRLNEAITHFSKALQIKPDDPRIHSNLGVALVRQERLGEAVGHFSEALRLNPNDENARHNLGFVRRLMGPAASP